MNQTRPERYRSVETIVLEVSVNMYLLVLCVVFLVSSACGGSSEEYLEFSFPDVHVQAFYPRGLRVSVADVDGTQLFAFHGNINRMLESIDAGDLSRDIVKKKDGRWIFDDNTQLVEGDVIYYWLFLIRYNLGYRLDNQRFTVKTLEPQPDNFLNRKPGKPRPRPPVPSKPVYLPTQRPVTPSPCQCPVCPTMPALTTTTPAPQASTPSNTDTIVNIWAESLNNVTEEKIELTKKVEMLLDMNEHLIKVIQNIKDPNLRRLKMSGRIPPTGDPELFVISVLREKLVVRDIVVDAERQLDNSILFEMESYEGKLKVLQAVKEKLANSQILISDIMVE